LIPLVVLVFLFSPEEQVLPIIITLVAGIVVLGVVFGFFVFKKK